MRAFIFSQCLFSLQLHIGPSLTWIEAVLATWGAFGFISVFSTMAILLSGQSSVFLLIWISIVKFSELFLTTVTYSFLQTLLLSVTSYEY